MEPLYDDAAAAADVEFTGERTWEERDAQGRREAVDVDDDNRPERETVVKAEAASHHDGARVTSFTSAVGSKYYGPVYDFGEQLVGTGAKRIKLAHGPGRLTFENGDVYEGDFSKGMRHGHGKFTEVESGQVYEGEWTMDIEYKGKLTFGEGGFYDGQWSLDTKKRVAVAHGLGISVFKDGDGEWKKYDGEWKLDKKDGRGMLYNSSGDLVREGWWKADEQCNPPEKKKSKYPLAGRMEDGDDEHYVLIAEENETMSSIARELEHGCTPEALIELNEPNFNRRIHANREKMRRGRRVWLPVRASLAYLLGASKAETRAAEAEVEALKAKAKAAEEAVAATAAATAAAAEARTTAAGSKHQARRPEAESAAAQQAPLLAADAQIRIENLKQEIGMHESRLEALNAEKKNAFASLSSVQQQQDSTQLGAVFATIKRLDEEKKAVEAAVSTKRALVEEVDDFHEEVRLKRQRLQERLVGGSSSST
jgi:hypothetical protein